MAEPLFEINCLGLKCPIPVLRLEKAWQAGRRHVQIVADDPVSVVDIPHAAQKLGAQVTTHSRQEGGYTFVISNEFTYTNDKVGDDGTS